MYIRYFFAVTIFGLFSTNIHLFSNVSSFALLGQSGNIIPTLHSELNDIDEKF